MSVRFGVFVPQGWKMDLVEIADPVEQYEAMTEVARVADAGPWDAIWLYDHFHTVPEPTLNTVFECWTATSTLARDTSRVRIGQMVGCNGYRQPSLYAKIASTVDVASKGRLIAGLGAGWYEHEWKAYGYEWKDVPQRMGEFREAVEVIHKMWTEDRPVFSGKHYAIDQPINQPRRKPDFWLGGGGEKVTLKLVAQYADGCNVGGGDPELVRHKLGVLREHCDRLGRDYDAITKSTTIELDLAESTADTIARVERVAEAGADYVLFYIPRVAYDHAPLLRLAEELVPRFR
ncbi:LLM class F420-dependent oxidoreductase [Paractinoplanes brasiliensis]|uniref:F420-dependent oxidoreductase-like protein n=1 Tax=Paractinoplanes brasiliensis TaxID=52695 RepID=A0A4R6J904_9ACTN|nr:LLM class F420-dependent oxidoreductase [Actinoplanes brasiliensis]TDO31371.1 F420-dependent oxidoreductase-like protein [Actinoplanes brasiliensis]GID28297.1 LLM class F420-dependent oxidoreductase [Actinoplanes brasiliensis]